MIRLTEIKLPLDHEESAIQEVDWSEAKYQLRSVISFNIFKRGYDARKKSKILLIYTPTFSLKTKLSY